MAHLDDWYVDPPVEAIPLPAEDLSGEALAKFLTDEVMPIFEDERCRIRKLEAWGTGKQPESRNHTNKNKEKQVLQRIARNPWIPLMISTFAQQMIVDGYRRDGATANEEAWDTWEFNNMKSQQFTIARSMMIAGYTYVRATDGVGPTGKPMAALRVVGGQNALGVYADPGDEYPQFLLEKRFNGTYRWWTDSDYTVLRNDKGTLTYVEAVNHDYGVVPFVRYVNQIDDCGRTWGDVEPVVELAARLDKTAFDRLLVQHYNSFKIRWAVGLEQPDTEEEAVASAMQLQHGSFLISSNEQAKFGVLDETRMDPFIAAYKADLETFLTIAQLPPDLAGLAANLSADAMEGARRSTYQKLYEKQTMLGQSHAQVMRLAAKIEGREDDAADFSARIHWQDVSVRSLAQFADAWGKMVVSLGIPKQKVWGMIPGVDQAWVKECEETYFEDSGPEGKINKYLRELGIKQESDGPGGPNNPTNQKRPEAEA